MTLGCKPWNRAAVLVVSPLLINTVLVRATVSSRIVPRAHSQRAPGAKHSGRVTLDQSVPSWSLGLPSHTDAHLDGKVFLAQNKVSKCASQNQVDRSLYKSMRAINTCGIYWPNNPP